MAINIHIFGDEEEVDKFVEFIMCMTNEVTEKYFIDYGWERGELVEDKHWNLSVHNASGYLSKAKREHFDAIARGQDPERRFESEEE